MALETERQSRSFSDVIPARYGARGCGTGRPAILISDTTAGGIVLPDSSKETPNRGTIDAVGPGKVMDNGSRGELQVKVGEVQDADDIFSKLMGDVVEPRREFIQNNALNVENLDF